MPTVAAGGGGAGDGGADDELDQRADAVRPALRQAVERARLASVKALAAWSGPVLLSLELVSTVYVPPGLIWK